MAGTDRDKDRRLDALVRFAAERPTDEARLAARVLARIRPGTGPQGVQDWLFALPVPRLVPAGFGAVLALTPIAIATLPGADDPLTSVIEGLAFGAPAMLDPGLGLFLAPAVGGDLP